MKGDFRPLIRPDIADKINSKASEVNMDKTILTNLILDVALSGNFVLEIETKKAKIRVADNAYLTNTSPMRKEIL